MQYHSYKHYLSYLESQRKRPVSKLIIILSALILIPLNVIAALIIFYQKEAPVRAQIQYLETASGNFSSSKQSLNEIISTFQVAGTKVKAVESLKESTLSADGFFVNLDDSARTIEKIESSKKTLAWQKNQLEGQNPPAKFLQVHTDLIAYYNEAQALLDLVEKEQRFAKRLFVILGPNFYLPNLGEETQWKDPKEEVLISYYQDKKDQAEKTVEELKSLEVPENLASYHANQIKHLELVIKTSEELVKILSEKSQESQPQTPEAEPPASKFEIALQRLNQAKLENEKISADISKERQALLDTKKSLEKFAPVSHAQYVLSAKIEDLYANQKQPTRIAQMGQKFEVIKRILPLGLFEALQKGIPF